MKTINEIDSKADLIEDPSTTWLKRWFAHLADFSLTIILNILIYIAIVSPIAKAITNYEGNSEEMKSAIKAKFEFLGSLGILELTTEKKDAVDTGYGVQYKNADSMTKKFIQAYLKEDGLGDSKKWNDNAMNYYLNTSKTLTKQEESSTLKSFDTTKEYATYLESVFNNGTYKIFTFDEKTQLPQLNDEPGSSKTPDNYSIKKQLRLYIGENYLLEGEKASQTDSNKAIYSSIKTSYNALVKTMVNEAISSAQEHENEKAIVNLNTKLSLTNSTSIVISFLLAFILYNTLFQCIFKYGRPIGKKILGFYVIDKENRKAQVWQHLVRTACLFFEQFWGIVFNAMMVFGLNTFNAPLFLFGNTSISIYIVCILSFALFLISAILAFILRKDMTSLHDLFSHTKCVKFKSNVVLNEFFSQREEATDLNALEKNLEGKN